jgi:hypothetical protein
VEGGEVLVLLRVAVLVLVLVLVVVLVALAGRVSRAGRWWVHRLLELGLGRMRQGRGHPQRRRMLGQRLVF